MKTTIEDVQKYAKNFLEVADLYNNEVSAYLNGAEGKIYAHCHDVVIMAEQIFLDAYNSYYDENIKCCLNYELAESVL